LNEEELLKRKVANHPKRVVAVDLDGTLAHFDHWRSYLHIGKPIPKVINKIRQEKKLGAYVIIFSCRTTSADNKVYMSSVDNLRKWLKTHRVPYDEVWLGTGKPYANIYIDDKAVNHNCAECCKREGI
jgi:capsule biosynthesis phosphatase